MYARQASTVPSERSYNPFPLALDPIDFGSNAAQNEQLLAGSFETSFEPSLDGAEPDSNDPLLAATNQELAEIFTDGTSIARINRAAGNDIVQGSLGNHFRSPEGQIIGAHIYGNQSADIPGNVFCPAGFNPTWVGGNDGTVAATDPKTGDLLHFYHVAGVASQKDLDRNLNTENPRGSRLIGQTGGKNGASPGYMHTCIRIYRGAKGYEHHRKALAGKEENTNSNYGDLRRFLKKPAPAP